MSGPWFMLAGAVTGALITLPLEMVALTGCCGIACAIARIRTARPIGVFLIALSVVMLSVTSQEKPVAIEDIARRVPLCDLVGSVAERLGGWGVLVSVERLECEGVSLAGDLGTIAVNRIDADAGGTMISEGRLFPLGGSGSDRGWRRAGADAAFAPAEIELRPPRAPLKRLAARMRAGVIEAASTIDARRGGLLAGLTIGETSGLDVGTEERMRRAGLSHLVAVSGSNVAIVVGAAMLVVQRAGRFASLAVAAVALLVYTLTVGPEPSVLRASTMGAIGLVALAGGRKIPALAALCVALSLVVAARPQMVHSVGLQLSAAATAGLILWARPLADRVPILPRPVALGLGATLAANVAVAPVLIGVFGELSLISPVANLLAMAAVPPATILGLVAGIVAGIHDGAGSVVAHVAAPFSGWILAVGDGLGAPDAAAVKLPRPLAVAAAVPVVAAAVISAGSLRTKASSLEA